MSNYCQICNKPYASYQSLFNHRKRYHSNSTEKNVLSKCVKNDNKLGCLQLKKDTNVIKNIDKDFKCEYCNKSFTRKYTLTRHYMTCKVKYNYEEQNCEPKIVENIKRTVLDIISKKVDSETLNEIKNSITKLESDNVSMGNSNNVMNHSNNPITNDHSVKNNNSNNHSNNTNSININLVTFGKENLLETLTEKEQIKILKEKRQSLNSLVKYVHCNEKFPQFQNVYVNEPRGSEIYIYDENKQDFKLANKDQILDQLIIDRMNDINDFHTRNHTKITKQTSDIIKDYIDRFDTELDHPTETKYIKQKKNEIKTDLYNNRQNAKNNIKKSRLELKLKH